MAFIETRFPDTISYGAVGGPEFMTNVVRLPISAATRRTALREVAVWKFRVDVPATNDSQKLQLRQFFLSFRGQLHGFRFKDWSDYRDEGLCRLGAGVGSGLPSYQVYKRYAFGSLEYLRALLKLVSGTSIVKRNGSAATAGAGAGQYAIDLNTGIVTFVADVTSPVTAVTTGSSTQVTLTAALSGLVSSGKLYLAGLGGADAALLNGQAHTISGVAGAVYTLTTNTAGKTITPGGGGYGAKFPQPTDTLTWEGEFDVPCRLGTDALDLAVESFSISNWNSLEIVEDR